MFIGNPNGIELRGRFWGVYNYVSKYMLKINKQDIICRLCSRISIIDFEQVLFTSWIWIDLLFVGRIFGKNSGARNGF